MTSVTTTLQGDTLFVDLVLYDEDDDLSDSDTTPTIEFWKGNELVFAPAQMGHLGIGTYRYRQLTATMSLGQYHIVCRARIGGYPVVESKTVEVTRPWQRSASN